MQHDNDDEERGSEGPEPCLHCMIRETIDMDFSPAAEDVKRVLEEFGA